MIESLRAPRLSGADAAFCDRWYDLWVERSDVCAVTFDRKFDYDPALPDRVALRDKLRPDESASAAKAYKDLTAYFKYDHSHNPEHPPTLGPLALCAPNMSSWNSMYAKAMRDFKTQGTEKHGSGQG